VVAESKIDARFANRSQQREYNCKDAILQNVLNFLLLLIVGGHRTFWFETQKGKFMDTHAERRELLPLCFHEKFISGKVTFVLLT
jgi:hypothetical protein